MKKPSAPPLPVPPPSGPQSLGWGWRAVAATMAFTVVATVVLAFVIRGLASMFGFKPGTALVSPVLYLLGTAIYLAVITGVYLFAARRAGWAALGLRAAHWSSYILVLPLFVLEVFALVTVNTLVGRLVGSFENPQMDAITGGQALSRVDVAMLLVLVAGLVPFAEELFFRGMLYPLLQRRFGALGAVIFSAAIFAGVHFIPILLPALFIVGLCLAFLRERSGSIWPGVCLHALQNGMVIIALGATTA